MFVNAGMDPLTTREVLGALGRGPTFNLITVAGPNGSTITMDSGTPCGNPLSFVSDGLSSTILLTEDAGRPFSFVNGRKSKNPRVGNAAFGTDFVADGWGWADINGGISIDGSNNTGAQNNTSSNGTVSANVGNCIMNCTNDSEIYSFHLGGAHFVMGDASVQFFPNTIDAQTFVALVTPNRGDTINDLPQ
jgi:hypothetical protein